MISEPEFAAQRYTPNADYYRSVGEAVRIDTLVRFVGSGRRILDIGCYDGTIAARIVSQDRRIVYGIDASVAALSVARQRGVIPIVGAVNCQFPFRDCAFDVVVAGEIIEHLVDTDFFLHEIWRVLEQGGTLVLSTPNVCSLPRRLLV